MDRGKISERNCGEVAGCNLYQILFAWAINHNHRDEVDLHINCEFLGAKNYDAYSSALPKGINFMA